MNNQFPWINWLRFRRSRRHHDPHRVRAKAVTHLRLAAARQLRNVRLHLHNRSLYPVLKSAVRAHGLCVLLLGQARCRAPLVGDVHARRDAGLLPHCTAAMYCGMPSSTRNAAATSVASVR